MLLFFLIVFWYYNLNAEQIPLFNMDSVITEEQIADDSLSNISFLSEDDLVSSTQYSEKGPMTKLSSMMEISHKKRNFYASFSGGKTYNDNSEIFVDGIRAIGDRMVALIDGNSWSPFIKNILTGEINSISQFDGKIDFQWLGNTSLGFYVGKNGRIDSEIVNFKMNIQDSQFIFDKPASIFAFLLNLYYSPQIKDTKFAPYIGIGIGPTIFRLKRVNKSSKAVLPLNLPWYAYQVKLGVDYSIMKDLSIFFGYRYFNIPVPITDRISTHNIEMGVMLYL